MNQVTVTCYVTDAVPNNQLLIVVWDETNELWYSGRTHWSPELNA